MNFDRIKERRAWGLFPRWFEPESHAMNEPDLVALHLEALEKSLGTPDFDTAFAALSGDPRVTAPVLAEIATRFVSRTPKSAPKRQTLQRIYARHAALVDLARKNEWQRGKGAA